MPFTARGGKCIAPLGQVRRKYFKLNIYSACRRRGGVLNSPRFCFFFIVHEFNHNFTGFFDNILHCIAFCASVNSRKFSQNVSASAMWAENLHESRHPRTNPGKNSQYLSIKRPSKQNHLSISHILRIRQAVHERLRVKQYIINS